MKATGINVFEGARRISLLIKIVWVLGSAVAIFMQTPSVSLTYKAERPSAAFHQAKDCAINDATNYKTVTLEDRNVKITTKKGTVFNSMQDYRKASASAGVPLDDMSDDQIIEQFSKPRKEGEPLAITVQYEPSPSGADEGKTVSVTLCFKAHPFENGSILVPYREEEDKWWGDEKYSANVTAYTTRRSAEFVLPKDGRTEALQLWHRAWWSGALRIVGVGVGGWLTLSIITSVIGWIVRGFFGIPSGKDKREPAG